GHKQLTEITRVGFEGRVAFRQLFNLLLYLGIELAGRINARLNGSREISQVTADFEESLLVRGPLEIAQRVGSVGSGFGLGREPRQRPASMRGKRRDGREWRRTMGCKG